MHLGTRNSEGLVCFLCVGSLLLHVQGRLFIIVLKILSRIVLKIPSSAWKIFSTALYVREWRFPYLEWANILVLGVLHRDTGNLFVYNYVSGMKLKYSHLNTRKNWL